MHGGRRFWWSYCTSPSFLRQIPTFVMIAIVISIFLCMCICVLVLMYVLTRQPQLRIRSSPRAFVNLSLKDMATQVPTCRICFFGWKFLRSFSCSFPRRCGHPVTDLPSMFPVWNFLRSFFEFSLEGVATQLPIRRMASSLVGRKIYILRNFRKTRPPSHT